MYSLYQEDGFRQLITLKCPPHMSKKELKDWWFKHAEKAKNLKGLKWYTVCFTIGRIEYSNGSQGQQPPFDGYEEMWFPTLDILKEAFNSKIMKDGLSDMSNYKLDGPEFFHGLWAEGNIVKMKGLTSPPKQKGCYRLFGGCKCRSGMSKKELKDWYHQHAERVIDEKGKMIIPEIIGYTHNFSIDGSPFGQPLVDAYGNNWWSSLDEMKKTLAGDIWKSQLEDREDHLDTYDKSLFIGAVAEEYIIDI